MRRTKTSKTLIREGRFREDLYYRLAEIVVDIPLTIERATRALLHDALVKRFQSDNGRASMQLGDDAVAASKRIRGPRQCACLETCIKRAVIMSDGSRIGADDPGFDSVDEDPTTST